MRLRSGITTLLVLACLFASAQEPLRPAVKQEVWTSVALQSRLPGFTKSLLGDAYSRIRVRNELGYRSTDVFASGKQIYLDVNIRYKLSDLVSVSYEHRFAKRPDQYGLRNRSILQAQVTKEFGRFETDYRFIYQHSYVDRGKQREVFRNRFQLGYNIKGWSFDPQVSVEFFTWASNKGLSYFGTRWQVSTTYQLNKANGITLGLLNDRERNVSWPTHRWIWSFTYTLNLRDL